MALALGIFALVAGLVYGFTANERTGATLLGILALGFFYIAVVTWGAARSADDDEGPASPVEEMTDAGEAVAPTIWPFGFSVAAVGLVLGFVVQRWFLVVGGVLFLVCCAGWYNDIRRQHTHGSNAKDASESGRP